MITTSASSGRWISSGDPRGSTPRSAWRRDVAVDCATASACLRPRFASRPDACSRPAATLEVTNEALRRRAGCATCSTGGSPKAASPKLDANLAAVEALRIEADAALADG